MVCESLGPLLLTCPHKDRGREIQTCDFRFIQRDL